MIFFFLLKEADTIAHQHFSPIFLFNVYYEKQLLNCLKNLFAFTCSDQHLLIQQGTKGKSWLHVDTKSRSKSFQINKKNDQLECKQRLWVFLSVHTDMSAIFSCNVQFENGLLQVPLPTGEFP